MQVNVFLLQWSLGQCALELKPINRKAGGHPVYEVVEEILARREARTVLERKLDNPTIIERKDVFDVGLGEN